MICESVLTSLATASAYRELVEGVAWAECSGSVVVSFITASAIEEFTDCTPGKRERWSRKNASYALMSRQTIRSRKSVSPIIV
jgi:hypothetical protein